MRKIFFIVASVFAILSTLPAQAKYHKKQDADYVREWCSKNNGIEQKVLKNGLRPDCTTENHVVEIDSVVEWEKNLDQANGYGIESGKKAKFIAVIEEPSQVRFFNQAVAKIKRDNISVEIEKLENFKSKEQSLKEIRGPIAKLSNSGNKCHVKGCGAYGATKDFKSFSTLAECLNHGGDIPGGIKEDTLWTCEFNAVGASSKSQVNNYKSTLLKNEKTNDLNPTVKMSLSGSKCHEKGSQYYKQTKKFKPFKSKRDCLDYVAGR